MRFTWKAQVDQAGDWLLDSGNRFLQEVEVFSANDAGDYLKQTASSKRVFSDRPLPTVNFVFPVTLPPSGDISIYLRVRSTSHVPTDITPVLWEPQAHQIVEQRHHRWTHAYLGLAFALAAFNFFLYLSLREGIYFRYVLSVVGFVLISDSVPAGYGLFFQYFWPDSPYFQQLVWMLSLAGVYVSYRFLVAFTELPRLAPRLDRVINVFYGLLSFWFVLLAFDLLGTSTAQLGHRLVQIVTALILGALFAGLLRLAWGGDRNCRLVLFAWGPLLVTGVVNPLLSLMHMRTDLIPPPIMSGSALELLLMSLILADRFNQVRMEKDRAQVALVEGLQQSERQLEVKVEQRTHELQSEQARTSELLRKNQDLLHNMLPAKIADELSETGTTRPVRHEAVTILFTDFSGFTQASSTMPPDRMVAELNAIFAAFDRITDECGVEKIKTIGDAYMAAAGVPTPCPDHAQRCVRAGLQMVAFVEQRNRTATFKWSLRVGLHTGPVVAGVVGTRKYAFDIWGDTVNIASRMESSGEVGRVNVSAYTYDLIREYYDCSYRGKIAAKGKGEIDMYFVNGSLAPTTKSA